MDYRLASVISLSIWRWRRGACALAAVPHRLAGDPWRQGSIRPFGLHHLVGQSLCGYVHALISTLLFCGPGCAINQVTAPLVC
jgi:hypothetical protein